MPHRSDGTWDHPPERVVTMSHISPPRQARNAFVLALEIVPGNVDVTASCTHCSLAFLGRFIRRQFISLASATVGNRLRLSGLVWGMKA